MDVNKVIAVTTWPTPTSIKELNFLSFCHQFSKGFRTIAAPLTTLLKKGLKNLQWSQGAEKAFLQLKSAFTTALILKHPDPTQPFMVKVDASETRVRGILSQHFGETPKLYPTAFFSKKFMPAEQKL